MCYGSSKHVPCYFDPNSAKCFNLNREMCWVFVLNIQTDVICMSLSIQIWVFFYNAASCGFYTGNEKGPAWSRVRRVEWSAGTSAFSTESRNRKQSRLILRICGVPEDLRPALTVQHYYSSPNMYSSINSIPTAYETSFDVWWLFCRLGVYISKFLPENSVYNIPHNIYLQH